MRRFAGSVFVSSLLLAAACAPDSGAEAPYDAGGIFVPTPDAASMVPLMPAPTGTAEAGAPVVVAPDAAVAPQTPDAATPSVVTPDAATPGSQMATLLPFHTGCTWTYRVTSATGTAMKVTTVGPEEPVGGTGPNRDMRAFRVTTTKGASDRTESWQAVVGTSVLRYREVAYSATTGMPELEEHWVPSKLHVHSAPDKRAAGARWTESYQETKTLAGMAPITSMVTDNWTIDAPKVKVTVPAGTFDAVVLMKSTATGQKTYWYVEGVGKVKETGGQTEELVSFDVGK